MPAETQHEKSKSAVATEPLKTELAYFNEVRAELLKSQEGRFALICGRELAGCWDTYRDAVQIGYDRFGLSPFLVKQVLAFDRVQQIFSLTEASIHRGAVAA